MGPPATVNRGGEEMIGKKEYRKQDCPVYRF